MDQVESLPLLQEARRHFGAGERPPFTQVSAGTMVNHSRRVIIPNSKSRYPSNTNEARYGIITAFKWDNKYAFWVLEDNGKYTIVQHKNGRYSPYFSWLGVGKGLGHQPVAWGSGQWLKGASTDPADTTDSDLSDESLSVQEIDEDAFRNPYASATAVKRVLEPVATGPRQKRARRSVKSEMDTEVHRDTDARMARREARASTIRSTLSTLDRSTDFSAPQASSQATSAPKEEYDQTAKGSLTTRERILNEKLKILDELLQIEEQKSKAGN